MLSQFYSSQLKLIWVVKCTMVNNECKIKVICRSILEPLRLHVHGSDLMVSGLRLGGLYLYIAFIYHFNFSL